MPTSWCWRILSTIWNKPTHQRKQRSNIAISGLTNKAAIRSELKAALDKYCKTFSTRNSNSRVWGLENKVNPKYMRTQRRYLSTSRNDDHTDPNALMGDSFTLTILQQPPGHEQPLHHHADEEEVIFVLQS